MEKEIAKSLISLATAVDVSMEAMFTEIEKITDEEEKSQVQKGSW